jgi:cobalt-zinc-cadmium efflux system protein
VTALLTFSMAKSSMNIRAAFLHNVSDALGSLAVIVAGTLIILYDWRLIDPLVTLLIAGYILWMSFAQIGEAIRILMLGSPPDIASVIRRWSWNAACMPATARPGSATATAARREGRLR